MNTLVENRKSQLINIGFVLLLMGATTYFLLKDNDLPELFSLIGSVNIGFLVIGLLVMVLFFTFEAGCLRTLMGSLDHKVSFLQCFRYSLIDFYFSSITPGCCGGQPSQIYYMKRDGIPIGASSLVLLLFNLAYHAAVLLIAFGSIAIGGSEILTNLGYIKYLLFFGIAAQTFLIVAFVITVFSKHLMPAFVTKAIGLLAKTPIIKDEAHALEKARHQIEEYQRGADYIKRNPKILLKVLILAMLHITALYSTSFWVYKAFGLTGVSLITLIAVQAALTLAVESLPIPGGMGITESSFLLLYGSIFGGSLVLPALLLCRGINYYAFLIIGGIVSAVPIKTLKKTVADRSICNTASARSNL